LEKWPSFRVKQCQGRVNAYLIGIRFYLAKIWVYGHFRRCIGIEI